MKKISQIKMDTHFFLTFKWGIFFFWKLPSLAFFVDFFCWSQIKLCLVLQKWKEGKNSYGGYPTEFAGSTQNPKKIIRTPNLPIRTKNSKKKTMLRTLKKKRSQKFVWELPDGICRLTGTPNLPFKKKISQKK
jgi:hypothetical protein